MIFLFVEAQMQACSFELTSKREKIINLLTKVVRFCLYFACPNQSTLRNIVLNTLTILTDVQFYSQFQLLDVLEMHPEFYIQFIQSSLQLAVTYNFTESGTGNLELKRALD